MFTLDFKILKISFFIRRRSKFKFFIKIPFITINYRLNDPFLTLSRQFLVSNNSNYNLIHQYLN